MKKLWLTGLLPAVFTPMGPDGELNLEAVGPITDRLVAEGVSGLYICGSTGEGPLLSREERMATAEAYIEAAAGRIPTVVQVGQHSIPEARILAEHAQSHGADAISAIPPAYFKPSSLEALVKSMAMIAGAAPELPFFYYHIPGVTGVELDLVKFLELGAELIPTLAGAKYSTFTMFELQRAIDLDGGRFNLLSGPDEMLLSAIVVGVHGAVGSTYNFATPLYRRIIEAFERGDLVEARRCQGLSARMVREIEETRAGPGLKAMMKLIGFDCGGTRMPQEPLSAEEEAELRARMEAIGFFDWGRN